MNDLPLYPSTQWTRLEQTGGTPEGRAWFCEEYRPAVLAYLRSRYQHHEAEDLCQEFFAKVVLGRDLPGRAERGRGPMRAYLHQALRRFLINKFRDERALKRGGGKVPVALDAHPSTHPDMADHHEAMPDRQFDRAWAVCLLERALASAEAWATRRRKGELFDALRPLLDGSGPMRPHAEIAAALGMKVHDVTVALNRLRQLVGRCMFEEVSRTVRSAQDAAAEWQIVREVLENR